MILNKEEIKEIIERKPDENGLFHITEEESLNLIETMIFDKKDVKVGDIESPASTIRSSRNVGKLLAQRRYQIMDIATNYAIGYFTNKMREI